MRKHHGQEGRAYIAMGGQSYNLCALTEWSLEQAADQTEVTSFCDANKTYVRGKPDLTGSLSGYWDSDSDILFDAYESPNPVMVYLYPSTVVPAQFWYGPAWMLGVTMTVGVTDATTVEANFAASGSWTRAGAIALAAQAPPAAPSAEQQPLVA
jgi:hypothetical protein